MIALAIVRRASVLLIYAIKTVADLCDGRLTYVGIYEACNNKVSYYHKSVMRRVYLGE